MTKLSNRRLLTDDQEDDIQRQIAIDPDNPEATDEELARARPFADALPDLYASIQRSRGRPKVEHPKQRVTIRLDADVLDTYRAGGRNWQTRINDILRKAAGL
jgi:uncharacterized protein (DUF4415 family)